MEHRQRGFAQPLFPLRRDGGGADLLRRAGLVLVLVVIKAGFGDDLDGGQGSILQDAYLDLPPGYVLLHHTHAAEGQPAGEGGVQRRFVVDDGHADRRPGGHRLYNAGQFQAVSEGGNVVRAVGHQLPLGRGHSQRGHDALGQVFIHGNGAAQIARASVGDAQQLQRGLDLAVLAAGAVEGQEHCVRHAAQRQHAGAELTVATARAGGLHLLQVGGLTVDFGQLRRDGSAEQGFGGLLSAQIHVDKGGLVPPLPQSGAHLAPTGQGHVPLATKPAGQNNDFHSIAPYRLPILLLFYA